jgi:hypothetical protein
MSDQEIITAFEKLHRLHSTSGEAVGQFAAIGAIREVIFRPGSVIFAAYERDAREARDAVKLLGDPKAIARTAITRQSTSSLTSPALRRVTLAQGEAKTNYENYKP